MVEAFLEGNAGHEAVEASGNWRPFGVFLADALFSVDLKVDLLILPEFGNDDVLMDKLDPVKFGSLVALGDPLELAGVNCVKH